MNQQPHSKGACGPRGRVGPAAAVALAGLLLAAGTARAAGGHHAVDDAALLEPGQCELEGWAIRPQGGGRTWHAGAGCRVGPVELGLAAEHERAGGTSTTSWLPSLKWATPLGDHLSVGASLGPVWQARAKPRYQGTAAIGLLTWSVHERLALHLNAGRALAHRGPDERLLGVSAEWTSPAGWSAVIERDIAGDAHHLRAGLRFAVAEQWSVDFSRVQRVSGPGASGWTFGVTRLLQR